VKKKFLRENFSFSIFLALSLGSTLQEASKYVLEADLLPFVIDMLKNEENESQKVFIFLFFLFFFFFYFYFRFPFISLPFIQHRWTQCG